MTSPRSFARLPAIADRQLMREVAQSVLSAPKEFFGLARDVIRAEGGTTAGRVNAFGLAAVFLLVAGGGLLFGLLEAIIRIAKEDYTTGFPSALSIVIAYGLLLLGCVLILAATDVIERRKPRA